MIFLTFLLKGGVEDINFLAVRISTFLAQFFHSSRIRINFRQIMLRVCVSDAIEIITVDDYATFLHNSERTLSTRLLHIPHHLVIDSLKAEKDKEL